MKSCPQALPWVKHCSSLGWTEPGHAWYYQKIAFPCLIFLENLKGCCHFITPIYAPSNGRFPELKHKDVCMCTYICVFPTCCTDPKLTFFQPRKIQYFNIESSAQWSKKSNAYFTMTHLQNVSVWYPLLFQGLGSRFSKLASSPRVSHQPLPPLHAYDLVVTSVNQRGNFLALHFCFWGT